MRRGCNRQSFRQLPFRLAFDDLESIKAFTGEDYAVSHVPAPARAVLSRFDERAAHHEVVDRRPQPS